MEHASIVRSSTPSFRSSPAVAPSSQPPTRTQPSRLEDDTRSRVQRWLHQLGSQAETRHAFERLSDHALVDEVVTLLLAVPEVQRVAEDRPRSAWPWSPPWERFRVGDLVVDGATREVRIAGERVALEPIERALLEYLVVHRGRVVSRDELLRCVWGGGRFRSRVADAYVGRLRRKLEGANVTIATVRGAGYRLIEANATEAQPAASVHADH